MSSDTGGGIIIIRKMNEPAFYDEVVPGSGSGNYLAKVKVWHVLVAAFALGALIF